MINQLFACSLSMQVWLGRHGVQDRRFRASFHDREPGLAERLSAVIDASARRHGVDPALATWE